MSKTKELDGYLKGISRLLHPDAETVIERVKEKRNKLKSKYYRFLPVPRGTRPLKKEMIYKLINQIT